MCIRDSLWEARRGGLLHHDAYNEMGELRGAVARRAEEVYQGLDPAARERFRAVLLRLVRPGEGAADTRRRASLVELGEDAGSLVTRLVEARLVVTGRDEASGRQTAEVVHEALIRGWERLGRWLDADREFLLWRQRLSAARREWERTERDEGALLRGVALEEAERWRAERGEGLSEEERGFLEASAALRESELRTARVRRRRQRLAAAGAVLLIALGALLATWAWLRARDLAADLDDQNLALQERGEELELERRTALARQLGARAEVLLSEPEGDVALAALLAAESLRRIWTFEGLAAWIEAVDLLPHPVWREPIRLPPDRPALAVTVDPSGGRVACGDQAGFVQVLDARTGKELARLEHPGRVTALALGAGELLACGMAFEPGLRVWDLATGDQVARLEETRRVRGVAFGPRGELLGTLAEDGRLRCYRTADWSAAGESELVLEDAGEARRPVVFDREAEWLAAAAGDRLLVLSVADMKTRLSPELSGPILDLAFRPEGELVAAIARKGARAVTLDAVQLGPGAWPFGAGLWPGSVQLDLGLERDPRALAFDPRGELLAVDNGQGLAWVIDLEENTELSRVPHGGRPEALALGGPERDETVLALAGEALHLWRATPEGVHMDLLAEDREVLRSAFAPDGSLLVAGTADGELFAFEADTFAPRWEAAFGEPVHALEFDAPGERVVAASAAGTVAAFDAATGEERFRGDHGGPIARVFLDPGGGRVATDAAPARPPAALEDEDPALPPPGDVRLWDFRAGVELAPPEGGALSSAPDGEAAADPTAIQAAEQAWLEIPLGPGSGLKSTTARDATLDVDLEGDAVILREVFTGRSVRWLELPGPGHELQLHPDGQRIAVAGPEGLWVLASGSGDLVREVCTRLTRNLTAGEWAFYLRDEPRGPTCTGLPLRD